MSAIAPHKAHDADAWDHHSKFIEILLRRCPQFIVYLDRNLDVQWEDTHEHCAELTTAKVPLAKIQGMVTCLEAIPTERLHLEVKRAFRSILGEAMCGALEKDTKAAQLLLLKAEDFVMARNHELARGWYVTGSAIATAAAMLLSWSTMRVYVGAYPAVGSARLNILAVGMGGGVGSLLSILLRVGRAPLDPAAGTWIHYLEGAARIIVGIIGAVIVLCAIRAQLILPHLKEPYGIVLACLVAGASERFATAIIERVEGVFKQRNESNKEHSVPTSKE